ncbi:Alkaline phosphatase D precursor [Stieleria maiorica]|uniref:Alkaline phosphatase D n=2 Tax=Stieleria maiorica TaxID=2795974 RepID=A0A5B9MLQ9_9BACT|nr:Alkaline phosphatase D precursor [Stieleria maiorica]
MLRTVNNRDPLGMRPQIGRRSLLSFASLLPTIVCSSQQTYADASFKTDKNPFTLGIASGDPDHRGVVLWTRLAPDPLQPGGGMPARAIEVSWEVAADESMRNIVSEGSRLATPALGHSIHVELDGLKSDRWYWYRFRCGDAESPIGRTRTMPHPDSEPSGVRFAVTSCQNYEQGLYTAYEQMARDELDLVFHLGDYIYEYAAGRNGKVRTHHGAEIQSLDDYRARYAQYRSDPLLQRMHAQCPWIVTWDDHEFDNNCANDISEESGIDPVDYLARRANAYQAYYEMMPLRLKQMPRGSDLRLYRSAAFGRLAEFQVLDTRQYRSDQPNHDRKSPLNEAALARSQTMLGRKQRGWLSKQLTRSAAQWNVLAQQVMMGMVNRSGNPMNEQYSMDQWPGYSHERMELMRFLSDRRISNPVVLTGDIHSNWVNELRVDDRREDEPTIATEFVATSLSSGGNGPDKPNNLDAILAENPCVKFHNGERGYIRCEVTPERWKADFMVVDDVLEPGGNTFQRSSFVVESGAAKVHPA